MASSVCSRSFKVKLRKGQQFVKKTINSRKVTKLLTLICNNSSKHQITVSSSTYDRVSHQAHIHTNTTVADYYARICHDSSNNSRVERDRQKKKTDNIHMYTVQKYLIVTFIICRFNQVKIFSFFSSGVQIQVMTTI